VEDPCDVYTLVIVDDQGGDIVGWASKKDLFKEENKSDLGFGIGYAMTQQQLKEFKNGN